MPDNNKILLEKIISIQAWARGLEKEAAMARKILEGVSTPSVRPGYEEEIAKVTTHMRQRMLKKQIEK